MSQLSKKLQELNTNGLSNRKIADRATSQGHPIHHATVARYMRGEHPNPPKIEALEAIALGMAVPLSVLEQAASTPFTQEPFKLPRKADTLDDSERAAILHLIDVMVEAKKPAKSWRDNLPAPEDMGYHIGAPTPDGGEFRPDKYQDHAMLWERHGKEWKNHYTLAANTKKPNDDIEEPWT